MKVENFIIIFIVLLIVDSCNKKENEDKHLVIRKVFFDALDSLNEKHGLKDKKIVIGRHENNDVIEFIKEDFQVEFGNDVEGPGTLIKKLIFNIGDSMRVDFSNANKNYNIEWGYTNNKSYLTNKLNLTENSDKCLLYVTDIVYTENGKMGCFYLSIGGDENPAGYIVFIGHLGSEWKVVSILRKWGY